MTKEIQKILITTYCTAYMEGMANAVSKIIKSNSSYDIELLAAEASEAAVIYLKNILGEEKENENI